MCGIMCSNRMDGGTGGPCVEVAVTVIQRNFGGAAIGLSMGFAQATPVRVGNMLGGNRPAVAKIAAYIGGCLQASVCIAVGGMIVMTADEWVEWFELDAESIALLYSTMPLAAAWWLAIAVGCGSLRNNLLGLGLVRFAAVVQLIAFYPIGTLCGWALGFGHTPLGAMGLKGLWIGCLLGFWGFMIPALGIYFCRIDWQEQARLAVERSSKDSAAPPAEEAEEEQETLLPRR